MSGDGKERFALDAPNHQIVKHLVNPMSAGHTSLDFRVTPKRRGRKMDEYLFFEELDKALDGLLNAPKPIVSYLLSKEEATLEELQGLFDEDYSKKFVDAWLNRMIVHFAVERFWYPTSDKHTYRLSSFAKDIIEHIKKFRVVIEP